MDGQAIYTPTARGISVLFVIATRPSIILAPSSKARVKGSHQ